MTIVKKRILVVIGFVILLGAIFSIFANWKILQFQKFVVSAHDVPTSSLALVFGGGMNKDGSQSIMQADRVQTAVALYKAGKVSSIMMTGDDGGFKDDEVNPMRAMAIAMGVPTSSITIDPHGYRTYESCFREHEVYGITSTIVISQNFHLPRIIYFCSGMGIKTIGLPADARDYGLHTFYYMNMREALARVKGWWQLEVSKPLPRNLER